MRRFSIGREFLEHHLDINASRIIDQTHRDIDHDAHDQKDQSPADATGVRQAQVARAIVIPGNYKIVYIDEYPKYKGDSLTL